MKINIIIYATFALLLSMTINAHGKTSGEEMANQILSESGYRDELAKINTGIATILSDQRLADNAIRKMLLESKAVINEMLDKKTGTNAGKLINLYNWIHKMNEKEHLICGGNPPTTQEQFLLDNPLGAHAVFLMQITQWIFEQYIDLDGAAAGEKKFEVIFNIYLIARTSAEGSGRTPAKLLIIAPNWTKSKFMNLSDAQKRIFLYDLDEVRRIAAIHSPDTEGVSVPEPTAAQAPAYEAAYQFIVAHTPSP